jgi:hypothetical protein
MGSPRPQGNRDYKTRVVYTDQPRYCAYTKCGLLLVQREGENPSRFYGRETCNRVCGHGLSAERKAEAMHIQNTPTPRAEVLSLESAPQHVQDAIARRRQQGALR